MSTVHVYIDRDMLGELHDLAAYSLDVLTGPAATEAQRILDDAKALHEDSKPIEEMTQEEKVAEIKRLRERLREVRVRRGLEGQ